MAREQRPTDFTVVGAGAIGGTVGAFLARDGASLRFVDSSELHVEAMNAAGLTIETASEQFTVRVEAVAPQSIRARLNTVLIAVKSHQTKLALDAIEPWLSLDSVVVSMQNGLCAREIAGSIGNSRTAASLVNFAADYIAPGRIRYSAPGALLLGSLDGTPNEHVQDLATRLGGWQEAHVTDNIEGFIWSKLGYNSVLGATALVDEDMAVVVDASRPLMAELAAEIYEVAAHENIRLETFDEVEPHVYFPRDPANIQKQEQSLDRLVQHLDSSPKKRSGLWRDLVIWKRKTEIDSLSGYAVELGATHGLDLPLTRVLIGQVHDLEQGRRTMSWNNLKELESARVRQLEKHSA